MLYISEGDKFKGFLFQILSFFSIFQNYTNFLIFLLSLIGTLLIRITFINSLC